MWTEVIINLWLEKFPIGDISWFWWFVRRLTFLFIIWLLGLFIFALDGMFILYVSNFGNYAVLFGIGIMAFIGTDGLHSFLEWLPKWARPILKLENKEFEEFFQRGERWAFSFFPCLILAMMFFLFVSTEQFYVFEQTIAQGFRAYFAWNFAFTFFVWLLVGTGIWIVISQWLLIFRLSRQPLSLQLSSTTSKTFRPLALQTLYGAACVFLGTSIFAFISPPASSLDLVRFLFFVVFGALAFLSPFYNIHSVLLRLKKQELQKIEKEANKLIKDLKDLIERPTQNSRDEIPIITARLLALHITEKSVREAEDWPVDISFFSTLVALVLTPLLIELAMRIFLR